MQNFTEKALKERKELIEDIINKTYPLSGSEWIYTYNTSSESIDFYVNRSRAGLTVMLLEDMSTKKMTDILAEYYISWEYNRNQYTDKDEKELEEYAREIQPSEADLQESLKCVKRYIAATNRTSRVAIDERTKLLTEIKCKFNLGWRLNSLELRLDCDTIGNDQNVDFCGYYVVERQQPDCTRGSLVDMLSTDELKSVLANMVPASDVNKPIKI